MSRKIGEGKVSEKSSGRSNYTALWIYVPSKLANDSEFPFQNQERVQIEIIDGKLIISKKNELMNIIDNYGIENATIPKLLESRAQKNKNKIFLYFKDQTYSYKDVNKYSNQVANGLLARLEDLKLKRPKVAIMLPNCPEFLFCWFGASKAGCTTILVNNFQEKDIIEYILNDSRSSLLIIDYQFLNQYKSIIEKVPKLKNVIVLNAPSSFKYTKKYLNYNTINSKNQKNPEVSVKNWQKMEILYTAGATRKPQGILYRQLIIIAGLFIAKELERIAFDASDIIFCPLPLFNGFTRLSVIMPALFSDASIALTEKFDASTFWDEVNKYNSTAMCYFGWLLSLLLKQPPSEKDREHSVKWAIGSVAENEVWDAFEYRFGIPLLESWTLAEGAITINKGGSKEGKRGSIGKPIIGFDVNILDEKGKEVEPGRDNVGEIVARMNIPLMLDQRGENNWSHTGDLGYKDEDGYIYFVGREKDLIIKNKRMYNMKNIEKVTNLHPFVLESAVFKVPAEKGEENELKLCVVLKKPDSLTHKDIHDYLSENLPYFMVPRYIEFKEQIYKSPTERITTYSLLKELDDPNIKKKTWDAKTNKFLM